MIDPLPDNIPLPTLLTLYRRDLMCLPEDEQQLLEIPLRVTCALCIKHPSFWQYVMDFIQEGNVQLVKALANRDPEWDDEKFAGYVGKSAKGAILSYIGRTRSVYVPPYDRWHIMQTGNERELACLHILEHCLSLDTLTANEKTFIPDQTNMQQAFNAAKRKRIESLLKQLPTKEQTSLKLFYGIGGRPHSTSEISVLLHVTSDHVRKLISQAIMRIQGKPKQSSRELTLQERDSCMQTVYQEWLQQGRKFKSIEFARAVGCNNQHAHRFLRERGALKTRSL